MSNFSDYVFRQFGLRASINTIGLPGSLLTKVDNSSLRNYVPLPQGTEGQILTSNGESSVPLWRDNVPFEINQLVADTIVSADLVPFYDKSESATKKTTFAAFETALNHDNLVSGTIASHDTSATGAELTALTDNSIANTLHRHSELVASDGSPDPALLVNAVGYVGINTDPAAQFTIKNSGNDTAPLGGELVSNGEFTSDLTSWTFNGVDWVWDAGKAKHAIGNVSTILQGISVTNGETYQVEFTTSSRTAGTLVLTFGAMVGIYGMIDNATYYYSFKATSTASVDLTFTPTTDWDGKIDDVTVKQITGISDAILLLEDSNANDIIEMRAISNNTFIGLATGQYSTTGQYNTAIGYQASYSNTTGTYNAAIGSFALYSNTTGDYNIAIGDHALYTNTVGYQNAAIGSFALRANTTGYQNAAIGSFALYSNTTGRQNTAIGYQALNSNSTGEQNIAIGLNALKLNTEGYRNTAIGYQALQTNTEGDLNIAIGSFALQANTTGENNMAIGHYSLYSNTTGNYNTAIGHYALNINTIGYQNVAIGDYALQYNTEGNYNAAVGRYALNKNTTGDFNTALGHYSLSHNTTSDYNTAVGYQALRYGTGTHGTAIGCYALRAADNTGNWNTAIGYKALQANTTGFRNGGIGYQALSSNTTGAQNTAIGYNAAYNVTEGDYNTIIGYGSGLGITTGDNNTIIGARIAGLAAGLEKHVIIADGLGNRKIVADEDGNIGFGAHDPTPGVACDKFIEIEDGTSVGIVLHDTGQASPYTIRASGSSIQIYFGAVELLDLSSDGNVVVKGNISSGTATITASADDTDVTGINTLFIDTTAGAIVLGGLVGGVDGQALHIVYINNFVNTLTIEHIEGINQDFYNHTGADEIVDGGGMTYVCNGTNWYDASHTKHV